MSKSLFVILCALFVLASSSLLIPLGEYESTLVTQSVNRNPGSTQSISSSSIPNGFLSSAEYIVIELQGHSVPAYGHDLSIQLNESGLVSRVTSISQVVNNPAIVGNASAIILDGSTGSNNGTAIPEDFLNLLIREDKPLILVGRAAWIRHRLWGSGSPQQIAPASAHLYTASGFESAVFLESPMSLNVPSQLTSETGLFLPVDAIQTETSRLINLTSSANVSEVPVLRYDSYPLDMFFFGPENPNALTTDGRGLLINTIAYSTSLHESNVTREMQSWQEQVKSPLQGGFHYPHEPTLDDAYHAVHAVYDLLDALAWSSWLETHQSLIESLLNSTMVGNSTEIGFKRASSYSTPDIGLTAQGLWLLSIMNLSSSFNVDKIVTYLSTRQNIDGGFDDDILVSYEVTEALQSAGRLNSIDTSALESWLRNCVIDGSKTSDSTLWGGIGKNPNSISPSNSRARAYVLSLEMLGTTHNDPQKLTNWIQTYTANGDGSYSDSLTAGVDVTIGTGAALTTMTVLGTLSSENHTTGLQWIADNQGPSGGFGFGYISDDLVGKTLDTSYVSYCLFRLGETRGPVGLGIIDYVNSIETTLGFERMDPAPSLMWTHWIMQSARLSHSADYIDYNSVGSFLALLDGWKIYPSLANMSFLTPIEYGPTQYRVQSVWTHYFGTEVSLAAGRSLTTAELDETTAYLTSAQVSTGHFRPTMFIGTASMQHSAIAVETLYQIGRLDQITYRSQLETAVLSEYKGGTWSTSGWNIHPFNSLPTAIDWFSTRAALRLGLLSNNMVSEIVSTIQSRIQYQDLLALSYDVATLSLLAANGYNVSMSIVDSTQVLDALGPDPFSLGWFNSTTLWQPVYTSSILRMISILGLRPQIFEGHSSTLIASAPVSSPLGGVVTVNISLFSGVTNHSIAVHAFGSWTVHTNLTNSDTILITVPSDEGSLGINYIYLIAVDYGSVRSSQRLIVEIHSELVGSMNVDSNEVRIGNPVTGTVNWKLLTNMSAGITNITIHLGNSSLYHKWFYQDVSPFVFSLPTYDFDPGPTNLTITLSRSYCPSIVLDVIVQLYAPVATYIDADVLNETTINTPLSINWALHYSDNGTAISGKTVSLQIRNETGSIVYEALGSSGQFVWTPSIRGNYSFDLQFDGEKALAPSNYSGTISVFEPTTIDMLTISQYNQYCNESLSVSLRTSTGTPLVGYNVTLILQSPSSAIIVQSTIVSDSLGHVTLLAYLSENGQYSLTAIYDSSDYYQSATNSSVFLSVSSTNLALGGIHSDGLAGSSTLMFVNLTDSNFHPVVGAVISVTITYLPSTVVTTYELTTNSSGIASFSWTAASAGSYIISGEFAGTLSYGPSEDSQSVNMWIPVTLTVIIYSTPEVNKTGWITIAAEDYLGDSISDLDVSLMVTTPGSIITIQTTGTTAGGTWTCEWTPEERGFNNVTVTSARQNWYEAAIASLMVGVYETPTVVLTIPDEPVAPTTSLLLIEVTDKNSYAVSFCSVRTVISLNGVILLDVVNDTDISGHIALNFEVHEPGDLEVTSTLIDQEWFLSASDKLITTIRGATSLVLTTPMQPIVQGTTIGLLVDLTDWIGNPVGDVPILFSILWANGSVLHTEYKSTGLDGTCLLTYTMDKVGDFLINASFSGSETNAPSSHACAQRVYVIPNIVAQFDSVCYLNDSLEIHLGVEDALDELVAGRVLQVSIEQDGMTVFEAEIVSKSHLIPITWNTTKRGHAIIHVLHIGDLHYYTNETEAATSVMEIVDGNLYLSGTVVEFEGSLNLTYALASTTPNNISILFQVLGVDLVPLWNITVQTNESGIALAEYDALDATGLLTVRVGPTENQYMLGGDVQTQITVMTDAHITISLEPDPPCAGEAINITILVEDELGVPLNGLSLTISARDPYGEFIKLGSWSFSVSVLTEGGQAIVPLTTDTPGLYTVEVQFSGSTFVHSFDNISQSIVFSRTAVEFVNYSSDLEVGDSFIGLAILKNHNGAMMGDRDISLTVNGPHDFIFGPILLTTNATGYVSWNVTLDEEGVYQATVAFDGLGVYLPSESTINIDVRYHVTLFVNEVSSEFPVAGRIPVNLSLKIADASGSVLEGFTITYSVYHETVGQVLQDSIIQTNTDFVNVSLLLLQGGYYSILVEFEGTSHYYPASVAISVFVYGTAMAEISSPSTIEISQPGAINVTIVNELDQPMNMSYNSIEIILYGPVGTIPLSDRIELVESELLVNLQGLSVGTYNLTVTVFPTSNYIGCTSYLLFNITAQTKFVLLDQVLTGRIGDSHSISFLLQDSLKHNLTNLSVRAYIYDPTGKEILGGLFQNGASIELTETGGTIKWTPSAVGVYLIELVYLGNGYLLPSSFETQVLSRFSTSLAVDMPQTASYGDDVPIIATIRDNFGALRNVPVEARIFLGDDEVQLLNTTSDWNGIVKFGLYNLLAGNYTIIAIYNGSNDHLPAQVVNYIEITPVVSLALLQVSNAYAGTNVTATISIIVSGAEPTWPGRAQIRFLDPSGNIIREFNCSIGPVTKSIVSFIAPLVGQYLLEITISNLPIINESRGILKIDVLAPPSQIMLDSSTGSLAVGLPLIAVVGLLIRKKLASALNSIPTDWHFHHSGE